VAHIPLGNEEGGILVFPAELGGRDGSLTGCGEGSVVCVWGLEIKLHR